MLSSEERDRLETWLKSQHNQYNLELLIKSTGIEKDPFIAENQRHTDYNLGRASIGRDLMKYRNETPAPRKVQRRKLWTRIRLRLAQLIAP